jgi:hypothetical protein
MNSLEMGQRRYGTIPPAVLADVRAATRELSTSSDFEWHMKRGARSEWVWTAPPASVRDFVARAARAVTRHSAQRYYVVVAPPRSRTQAWHYDSDTADFHTMLLQITGATDAGYTQFEESDRVFGEGEYCLFDGLDVHRGTGNRTAAPRVFVYVTFHAPDFVDANH